MQLFWRENRLQIEPADQKERETLLLLAEKGGLRQTSAAPPGGDPVAIPLEIEIEGPKTYIDCPYCASRNQHQHWMGRLPAIPGVECSGVSESDAFNGVIIQAFQHMAELVQRGWHLPDQVSAWFKVTKVAT